MSDAQVNWSVYACAQNLPAILNDPKRGKQKDFFTRTWGESFLDTSIVIPSPLLPEVPNSYFAPYCRKLLKRYRKLQERKSSTCLTNIHDFGSPNSFFPQLGSRDNVLTSEANQVPKIYFTQKFALSNLETFKEVYGVDGVHLPSKLVQDKLSHYLDRIEVGLAQQISKKSSAFFSAVSTQDQVAEKVNKAVVCLQKIKNNLEDVKKDYIVAPLNIVKHSKKASHLCALHQKLQLMGTVHQAQRAIQSLLGNSDYVGALDLITTTQEVLRQELQGLLSFRHLDSQLVEIRGAIEKMLRAELERNLSADLNRPVEQLKTFIDKDRLISIIWGYLRLEKVAPIVTVLSKEITTSMMTTCKQTLIEAVSESDSLIGTGSNSIQQAISQLPSALWIKMITDLGGKLVKLLEHIKEVILLFHTCADSAIGNRNVENMQVTTYMPEQEEPLISQQIFSTLSSELANQLEKTTLTADERFCEILRCRKTYLVDAEFFETLKTSKLFVTQLEQFTNGFSQLDNLLPPTFRYTVSSEMKSQTSEYFRTFHKMQTEIVNGALDREKWKPADKEKQLGLKMAELFKDLASASAESDSNSYELQDFSPPPPPSSCGDSNAKDKEQLSITNSAEVFFIIFSVIMEYSHLVTITENAEIVLGAVDLLRGANARIAHLVLGAGAVELKVCKSVTVANLAVVVSGLSLIANIVPQIKVIFQNVLPAKNQHLLKHVDTVHLEIVRHCEDVENKMVTILADVIENELTMWEARPPVPSIAITNVSKSIYKFREAIGPVLTNTQISPLLIRVDQIFRTKLKQRIANLAIIKDGGPRHGVVTSEMMHYAENLRKLNILPESITSNSGLTNQLWG